jgi:hypothetical protein
VADVAVEGEAVAAVDVGLDVRHLAAHVVAHSVAVGAEAVDVDAVLVGLDLQAVQAVRLAGSSGGGQYSKQAVQLVEHQDGRRQPAANCRQPASSTTHPPPTHHNPPHPPLSSCPCRRAPC